MHHFRAALLVIVATLLPSCVVAADEPGLRRFSCTILSDQQKGTVIIFDADSRLLVWGSAEPEKMVIESERIEPVELSVASEKWDLFMTGLRIWSEEGTLRFFANVGDSFFNGTCSRV
jgi:hypothetical protein